jgi:hypothetical protein
MYTKQIDDIRVLLCAPTGKAAYNIHGLTIHNAFQIQPNKGLDQSLSCDVLNSLRMKYRNLSKGSSFVFTQVITC